MKSLAKHRSLKRMLQDNRRRSVMRLKRQGWKEQPKNNKRQRPSSMLREGDVGISTYIGDHKGFTGIIKERYEDFVVHEIDEKNQVVHLTDFTCPIEGKVTSAPKESRTKIHQAIRQNFSNLDSNTVDEMNKKYIKVVQKTGNGNFQGVSLVLGSKLVLVLLERFYLITMYCSTELGEGAPLMRALLCILTTD
ncbi:putative pseudouridylate synthase 7-like [Apostichopus japonicus]|uniref:Putative pseudouridylate synthase 7-like n=1 Tax=Stichopus japonicus TaxID=307972 RepID=A0A2G8KZR6_STIJA|nr:putative pseudouridylate synthase 7-like [Apostichopus japonicus]